VSTAYKRTVTSIKSDTVRGPCTTHMRTGAVSSVRRQREAGIANAPKTAFSVIAPPVQTESGLIAFVNI